MKKVIAIVIVSLFLSSCSATESNLNHATGTAVTNSQGNPDIAKYKTFTVGNLYGPGTPQYLRDTPILHSLAFRFQQEGLKYAKSIDKADIVVTMMLIDAVGQDYIPPSTYTSVSYDPGVTTTNTNGMASGFGNFVNLQATSTSTSTASATATTTTTGGYFVPNYGIGMVINIYDVKTKALIWSGAGARRSNIQNIYPAVNDVILQIIDKHLITPSYINGQREAIRMAYKTQKQDEYLKPVKPFGFINNRNELNKVSIFTSLMLARGPAGSMLLLNMTIKNDAEKEIHFDPAGFKALLDNEELDVISKSDFAATMFNLNSNKPKEINGSGLIGFTVASIFNGVSNANYKKQTEQRDKNVRLVYDQYLDMHAIKPGENYNAFATVAGFAFIPDHAKVKLLVPLSGKNVEADYIYEPNWLTPDQFNKMIVKRQSLNGALPPSPSQLLELQKTQGETPAGKLSTVIAATQVNTGSVSNGTADDQAAAALGKLDAAWGKENQGLQNAIGTKTYSSISKEKAMNAMLLAFQRLDLIIDSSDSKTGFIRASSNAPKPLTYDEFEGIKKIEDGRAKSYVPGFEWNLAGFKSEFSAVFIEMNGGVQISLRGTLHFVGDATKFIPLTEFPPEGIKVAFPKIWNEFEKISLAKVKV